MTGDRRRAAVHRMKIPFCRRSRLQEIRFRPASSSEREASAPLSNLDSSGRVETLVLAHSSKTDRGNLVYRVGIDQLFTIAVEKESHLHFLRYKFPTAFVYVYNLLKKTPVVFYLICTAKAVDGES